MWPVIFKMASKSVAGSRLSAPSGSKAVAYPVPGIGASVSVKGVQLVKAKGALMRSYGKDWKSADIEGKVTGKPTKTKWRVDWSIGSTTVVLDHGRAYWKPQQEHSSASLALQTSRSETEVREEIQPSDNEKESEEDDGRCENSDTNPLHIKLDDGIVKWELLEGGVTVDQRVKNGFSSSCKCSITWPTNVEIAEFKDVGDCWGIMFPSDFFLVKKVS